LDVLLLQADALDFDLAVLSQVETEGIVEALGGVTGGYNKAAAGIIVVADSEVVGEAEAPVAVAALDGLEEGLAFAVGLVAVAGASLGDEALLVAGGFGAEDVDEGESRSEADAVGALDDGDTADGARVELADSGVNIEAGREEESAIAVGDELANAVAADARVGDDGISLLDFHAGGFSGALEQAADVGRVDGLAGCGAGDHAGAPHAGRAG